MYNKSIAYVKKGEEVESERSIVCYASTNSCDRHGEMILPEAWNSGLENYRKNPVILLNHDYHNTLPVGKSLWQKVDKNGLKFKIQFADTSLGNELYYLYSNGFMSSFSVGFKPVKVYDNEDTQKYKDKEGKIPHTVYQEVELLELSAVNIPANQDANIVRSMKGLVDYYEKGLFKSKEIIEIVEKIKNNPEYIELISKEEKLDHNPDLDLNTDDIDLDKVDQIDMEKYQEKSEELCEDVAEELTDDKLKELTTIAFLDMKIFYNEDGSFKYKKFADIPNDFSVVIEKHEEDENGDISELFFKDKTQALEVLAKNIGIFESSDDCENLEQKEQIENIEEVKEENLVTELDLIIEEEFKEIDSVQEVEEKKEINIDERINFYNSLNVKNIKNLDILKKEYGEDFDITKVRTEPANFEYKIFTKYLGCKIKDIFTTDFFIPNAMIGNFLSAFKNVLSKHELIDQRNFYGNGGEIPLQHSVVKLNSKLEEEFLVTGTQFYKSVDGQRFVFQIYKGWGGLGIDIFTTNSEENISLNKSFVKDAVQWVSENNYLKGEKFSISGDFLEVKDMSWDSVIFPSEEAKSKIKKNVEKLSSKSPSRGMMFVGEPGTGKTLTGKVLMNNKDLTFIWASSKDFRYGASSALSLGFEMARELAPSVFFLEDIDTWLNGYTVDLLKTEMDGIRENKGVLSILTSNFPEDIPDALIDRPGRFHHIINFSLPDKDNRVKLLKFFTEDADKDIIEKFADLTEGYSGAHLKELVEFAKMIAEDEEITIEMALIKSLEQMKEQRQLIQDLKTNVKKEVEDNITTKSVDFVEIELPVNKEIELDFDLVKVKDIFLQNIEKTFGEIDLSDLIDERLKKAKGVIEFED